MMAPSPGTPPGHMLAPPLKWAGGKRWLVPTLLPLWCGQSGRRLVEPFVGGMAVTLGLTPVCALLNDFNPHLINFYCWCQRGLVIDLLLQNDQALYYRHRDRFNELIRLDQSDTAEAASLFYFLNRTGYNGLCRFNRQGFFNVPFGRYRSISYTRDFTHFREALGAWTFVCGDFVSLAVEASDVIYADPPYDVEFTSYSAGGFSWADQVRLAQWLAAHPGPVIASNQATPRILDLYATWGFMIKVVDAPRRISCNGDRKPAAEMVATRGF